MGLGWAAVGAYSSQALWGWLFWQYVALFCLWGLAGAWGREETLRQAAAARLLVWGLGGLAALTGVFLLAAVGGGTDLGFDDLAAVDLGAEQQHWALAALVVSLAAYIPLFPLHTWFPGIGARSPLAAAAVVGLWGPMGLSAFFRLAPTLCADALVQWNSWLLLAASVSMLVGGGLALAQRDVLRRQAYAVMVFYGAILWGSCALPAAWGGVLGLGLHVGLAGAALFLVSASLAGEERLERVAVGGRAPLGGCWLAAVLLFCGMPGPGLYAYMRVLYDASAGVGALAAFLAAWVLVCVALLRPLAFGVGPEASPRRWIPALGLAIGATALALYPAPVVDYAQEKPWPPQNPVVVGEAE